mmetsp:Transcript_646/g.1023  ORF Transcript_646/g.1023 Transcript_646/m.1023 type:complete len:155 (-) Transcript_646:629-1093(-)|eukprot:CAMPEP_0178756376 /NCGR_PEP_ID=MMETSP0744-20121128/13241_1 /TAXON_ID=913974 /ORGANISM="Nitzschia punctata, Strain CCMP561" /LENGTH=154 /DNA_ID=CAMNT_0020410513 /DNA_START=217 /DNA_END=681 /DNA_ORIENTATION=-
MTVLAQEQLKQQQQAKVCFGEVTIREYDMILGINPAVKLGAPVTITWDYREESPVHIDDYERSRMGKRHTNPRHFYLSYYRRKDILESAGYSSKEFNDAERQAQFDQLKRNISRYLSFPVLFRASIKASMGRFKNKRFIRQYRREMKKKQQQQP